MPVGFDDRANKKMDAIASIAEKYGCSAIFPEHENSYPAFSLNTTVQKFKKSAFVLVDLSFERPSCYYELGIVETLGIPAYIIAEVGTAIHQTANRAFVHYYSDLVELSVKVEYIIRVAIVATNKSLVN